MNTEQLNALKDRAHKTAVEHGFHKDVKSSAYYLGLAMSKAGETITADREVKYANTKGFTDVMASAKYYFRLAYDSYIKGSVEDKIADTIIQLLDYAEIKGCKLLVTDASSTPYVLIIEQLARNGLSGTLFHLNGVLSDALDDCNIDDVVNIVISIISECFQQLTGSDKDLWWFVERKIGYNEVAPVLD